MKNLTKDEKKEQIKIYADIINPVYQISELKDQELTCCLTGEKFKGGTGLLFRAEGVDEGADYVHPDEAEKRGYVLTHEAKQDLYLYMHEANRFNGKNADKELLELLRAQGYEGKKRKVEKVTRRKTVRFEELYFRRPITEYEKGNNNLPF